ncbi:MAG: BtrH N-terminal domain-containing protein, partial [Deltaproteobacteria bacterium]|nr:BtrH N-terminal domain-containing protein [Deltaproteobacteria bacterium]
MPVLPITHRPGVHCASTGLRDLAAFHGLDWSEAMCFGLGAGLGLWYLSLPGLSPSRMVHVRSADIEEQLFTRIDIDFR